MNFSFITLKIVLQFTRKVLGSLFMYYKSIIRDVINQLILHSQWYLLLTNWFLPSPGASMVRLNSPECSDPSTRRVDVDERSLRRHFCESVPVVSPCIRWRTFSTPQQQYNFIIFSCCGTGLPLCLCVFVCVWLCFGKDRRGLTWRWSCRGWVCVSHTWLRYGVWRTDFLRHSGRDQMATIFQWTFLKNIFFNENI